MPDGKFREKKFMNKKISLECHNESIQLDMIVLQLSPNLGGKRAI